MRIRFCLLFLMTFLAMGVLFTAESRAGTMELIHDEQLYTGDVKAMFWPTNDSLLFLVMNQQDSMKFMFYNIYTEEKKEVYYPINGALIYHTTISNGGKYIAFVGNTQDNQGVTYIFSTDSNKLLFFVANRVKFMLFTGRQVFGVFRLYPA